MSARVEAFRTRESQSRTGQQDTTAFDGSVLFWLDTSMMDRTVRFSIERRGVTTTR